MQTYTCAACEFTFTEADKAWRDAIGTWQCPNCLKKLHDFPPGAQRTPEAELAIARPDADYGIALMAIPAVGTMLIWFWVSGMNLLQSPQDSLALIMVATIVGTGIVAAMEASKVMTELERKNGTSSPGFLFFSFLLLWFVAYPAYMFSRRTHGLPNLLAAGILLMLIFVGSSFALNSAIESKKGEIGKIFTGFQSQLKSLSEPDAEAKKALEDLQSQLASLAKQQESTQPAPVPTAQSDKFSELAATARQPAQASPSPTNISSTEKAQVSPQSTWKPSFDCSKASTFSEKAICNDPLLGNLDGALSENYKYMLASDIGDGARNDLKTTQKKWLTERNKCTNNQCLADTYRKRIDEVCEYPVISGAHPMCINSDDIK